MRRSTFLLTVTVAALTLPGAARAQEPITGLCPFPIDVTITANEEIARTTIPSGATILTGQLRVRVTNLENNKSVDLNVSGPVFDFGSGTTTYRGESLIGGAGFLLLTSGEVVFTNGEITSMTGTQRDVCAMLADP
jgi:hypothetical protein